MSRLAPEMRPRTMRQVSERQTAASRQRASDLAAPAGAADGVTGAATGENVAHQEHAGDDQDSASSDQDRKPASRADRARGLLTWPVVERHGPVRISKKLGGTLTAGGALLSGASERTGGGGVVIAGDGVEAAVPAGAN